MNNHCNQIIYYKKYIKKKKFINVIDVIKYFHKKVIMIFI